MVGGVLLLYNICAVDVSLCNTKSVVCNLLCNVVILQAAAFHDKCRLSVYRLLFIVRV
jgi:hypothetical protein